MKPPKRKHTTKLRMRTHSKDLSVTSPMPRAHAKIFMAVGMPMTAVAAEKYSLEFSPIPTANMWCAQTKNPTRPIDQIARDMPG